MKLDGRKLIHARHRKGLTQKQVSKRTKLSLPTIINAESGRDVFPKTGHSLCRFLEIDLAEVVLPVNGEEEDVTA